jgi:hypothetical protein
VNNFVEPARRCAPLGEVRSVGMVRNLAMPLLILIAFASTGRAGPFSRKPKPDPVEHVPALIKTLESDADERKRENAAVDLRDYDSRTFPAILPALIESLKNDPSHAVRHEAVNTIGKIRPITQEAGFAIEQAAANDHSFRVRAAAKATLAQWIIFGHRPTPTPELNQTEEPPLAQPLPKLGNSPRTSATSPAGPAAKPDDAAAPVLPLMPTPPKPTSRPLFPLFSSRSKPDVVEGPVLNPPK